MRAQLLIPSSEGTTDGLSAEMMNYDRQAVECVGLCLTLSGRNVSTVVPMKMGIQKSLPAPTFDTRRALMMGEVETSVSLD